MFVNMSPNMIDDGIKAINKEIEDYNNEDKTNVLEKEGSDELNQKLKKYGLKFKANTKVSTVLKKLNEHKKMFESEQEFNVNLGKMSSLKEGKKGQQSKDKKQESEEV